MMSSVKGVSGFAKLNGSFHKKVVIRHKKPAAPYIFHLSR